jgi:DME family drug/metabolite transporter
MNLRGYLYIFCAAILWGLIGPVARFLFEQGISPLEVAFWRAVLAWGFFAGHALAKRETRIARRDWPLVLVFAVFGVSLFFSSYQQAVKNGGAALAAVLLYTAPAWVAVLSSIFLKEKLTAKKLVALLLTLIGVAGVSMGAGLQGWAGGMQRMPAAVTFGLLAGFSYSLYYIFGKHFSQRYSSANLFAYMLPLGAVGLLPWVEFVEKSASVWTGLGFLASFSTYGAFFCYYQGVKYLEATRAAIAATLEPVVAAVIAYFWWGERFSNKGYVGGCLILCAVVLMVLDSQRRLKSRGD